MGWNYRVLRRKLKPESAVLGQPVYGYAIHEVYYDADGNPTSCTETGCAPFGESEKELREDLIMMRFDACSRPVLDYEMFESMTPPRDKTKSNVDAKV